MYAEYSECQRQGVANAAPSYDKILRTPLSLLTPTVDRPVDRS